MISAIISDKRIEITGHAGYAPKGFDIVCEAVSALTQTTEAAITPGRCEKASGHFTIDTEELTDREQIIVETLIQGLELLAGAYPAYLKVKKNDI